MEGPLEEGKKGSSIMKHAAEGCAALIFTAFLRIFKHLISTSVCLHIRTLYNQNTIFKI